MRGNFSTAGIPYSDQHGLVDNGPRRYEASTTDRPDALPVTSQAQPPQRPSPSKSAATLAATGR